MLKADNEDNEIRFSLAMLKSCGDMSNADQAIAALKYAEKCLLQCNQEDLELMCKTVEDLNIIVAKKQQIG